MRLTHIKLAGFKSFTDPTTIAVPGQLVAVIGPNGCGKSNVIDAVRWVLGEASAKQLRGESMQDVIFNGAATRRPAPRASVELVFNNSDHQLEGPWGQYSEISIKRQLTRQGESGYFINNQPVRRRDITDLFLGTGVGARGYAVIEQGMISRIIEARPEELRAYLEEAAGVSKYKERRRETEHRLKDTREHLQRLGDLQSELGRQVEKLQHQAQTAERYRNLTTELNQQQNLLDYLRYQESSAQAQLAQSQHQNAQESLNQAQAEQEQLNQAIQSLRQAETEQQNELEALNHQLALIREQSARLEEQLIAQRNLAKRNEREKLLAQEKLRALASEQESLAEEQIIIAETLMMAEEALNLSAEEVARCEAIIPELEAAEHASRAAQQSQQDEVARLKRELAVQEQQQQHARHNLAANQARQQTLSQEAQALNLPPEDEIDAAQAQLNTLAKQSQYWEQQRHTLEKKINQCKSACQEAETAYQTTSHAQLAASTKYQTLIELMREEVPANAASFWHDDSPELWQTIQISPQWQHAAASLLGSRQQSRAVATDFQPPQTLPNQVAAWYYPAQATDYPTDSLAAQIEAPSETHAILSHWLGHFLCSPNLETALTNRHILKPHQAYITPEGHQIDAHSVCLYAANEAPSLIERKAQADSLSQEIDELNHLLSQQKATLETCRSELAQHETALQTCHQQARQHHQAEQNSHQTLSELLARVNQGQMRRQAIEEELLQLEEEAIVLTQSLEGLAESIINSQEAIESLANADSLHDESEQTSQALKAARLALLEANRHHGIQKLELHTQQQQHQQLTQRLSQLAAQSQEWQMRQSELALAIDEEQQTQQYASLETMNEEAQRLSEQISQAQSRLDQTREQGMALYTQQQALASKLPQLQAATQTVLLQEQEAKLTAEHHLAALTEREAPLEALKDLASQSPPSLSELVQSIQKLGHNIQALGAVNLAALEELAEAQTRDEYYANQSQDLQAAIALLEEAIGQIDDETKARFQTTFDAVNEKVQTYFPTLFGGGEATLIMNGDDLLTAGVSIMARPPGKKNSTIHLLSGGEKALTAMSLVFALFSLNPAPFCLLDEVDAPLDDANTSRFCNLVKEMSQQTQFLYISHNRLTMEMAEQLIGVTMQEKGVSRIVAVDIQEALHLAEAN